MNEYCCDRFKEARDEGDIVLDYSQSVRYQVVAEAGCVAVFYIDYCPFCGVGLEEELKESED